MEQAVRGGDDREEDRPIQETGEGRRGFLMHGVTGVLRVAAWESRL